jgi:hypothetical protein
MPGGSNHFTHLVVFAFGNGNKQPGKWGPGGKAFTKVVDCFGVGYNANIAGRGGIGYAGFYADAYAGLKAF